LQTSGNKPQTAPPSHNQQDSSSTVSNFAAVSSKTAPIRAAVRMQLLQQLKDPWHSHTHTQLTKQWIPAAEVSWKHLLRQTAES
jgi:hypothetical protein